jgi:amino acid transporter
MSTTPSTPESTTASGEESSSELGVPDQRFRKELGFWSLTAIGFGGIIGSGWLFGAQYAAQAAGPASLVSWVIGGIAFALIALVLIELAASRPEAGGIVRWPMYANGALAATIVGWSTLLAISSASSAEASAITQYASRYIPDVYHDGLLTIRGLVLSAVLLAVAILLNWFGVRLFARVNLVITALKFIIPAATVIAVLIAGFQPGNVASGGGFAPYGWSAALSAVATAGIIYSINGFDPTIDLSGEVRNPRRDIPRAVLTAIALAVLLYLALQVAFLFSVPKGMLIHGWHGVNFSSPFGQLALLLNLGWLAAVLYADAALSPSGSVLVGVAGNSRVTFALAKNGLLPKKIANVNTRVGVPRGAMAVNFVLALIMLAPFRGWQQIIGITGDLFLLNYSVAAVAAASFQAAEPGRSAGWVRGIRWIAPVSFAIASAIIYWSKWDSLRVMLPLALVGVVIFALSRRHRAQLLKNIRGSLWLVVYLVVLIALSGLGSFGGAKVLPAPWDTILVVLASLVIFRWGVRSGRRHLRSGDS